MMLCIIGPSVKNVLNLYGYVGNNPVNFTDVMGLKLEEMSEFDKDSTFLGKLLRPIISKLGFGKAIATVDVATGGKVSLALGKGIRELLDPQVVLGLIPLENLGPYLRVLLLLKLWYL